MKERRGVSAQLNHSANSAATQPVNQARSLKRNQQIKTLHLEFEDLKKKIKDVEIKNVKIIENIHRQYDFRKKAHPDTNTLPVVHYDHNPPPSQEEEQPPTPPTQNKLRKNQARPQTAEYSRTENMQQEERSQFFRPQLPSGMFVFSPSQEQAARVRQFGALSSPYQYSVQLPAYQMGMSQVGQEELKREKEKVRLLEQELEEREHEVTTLKKMQKKGNSSIISQCSQAFETSLEEFFQEVLKRRMHEIEKCVKRSENRLRKLQLKLRDKEEEERSRRLIQEHRTQRSNSRSRTHHSPRLPAHPPRMAHRHTTLDPPHDTTHSKLTEVSRPAHFEEIAAQYQEVIRAKTKEVEESEIRLRQKDAEIMELTAKCSKLQLRAHDFAQIPKSKSRRDSQRDQNLLANLVFDSDSDTQILQLNKKAAELERIVQASQRQLSAKEAVLQKTKLKLVESQNRVRRGETEVNKLREEVKQLAGMAMLSVTIKQLETEKHQKEQQLKEIRIKCTQLEAERVKLECDNLSLANRLKKAEGMLQLKQDKVSELEKIIQNNVGGESDLLQHSLCLPDQQQLRAIQQQKEKLEEDLLKQRQIAFQLQKDAQKMQEQKASLARQLETLTFQYENSRNSFKTPEFQKCRPSIQASPLKQLLEEGDCLSEQEAEIDELRARCDELQVQLKLQSQKTFEQNRKALKLSTQLSYFKEQLTDREMRIQRLRKDHEEARGQLLALQQTLQTREGELQVQRRINADKIKEIQTQWQQFQQEVRQGQQEDQMEGSQLHEGESRNSRMLLESSLLHFRSSTGSEQQKLLDRLRQAEKMVQVQKEMQERIISEYRGNVERLKTEIRQKNRLIEAHSAENETIKRKLMAFQLSHNRGNKSGEQLADGPTQKVIELETELTEMRQLNEKKDSMEQELYNQLGQKEQELLRITQLLTAKDRRIEELEDLLELKAVNINSHISVVAPRKMRQSMQSHGSLRYSMLSNNPNKEKTIELDLSEVGQSFFDNNQSILSNVSEVFGREEFPYEKMHLKRVQQRTLFEKTAAYIKSLKRAIEEKNKKIKLLERKVQSLRNSELVRKDIYQLNIKEMDELSPDASDIFKDYYSVQLQSSHSHRYKVKQLEHETKLTIQQNNLLNNQIESMQEELTKAEEQEDSLMKLKDLYKDQIKILIKQNQDQLKLFEEEIKKQRQKSQQSDLLQKMQALRQVFTKVVNAFFCLDDTAPKSKKKQDRKKELEENLRVCCNMMNLDGMVREKMLNDVRQIKR